MTGCLSVWRFDCFSRLLAFTQCSHRDRYGKCVRLCVALCCSVGSFDLCSVLVSLAALSCVSCSTTVSGIQFEVWNKVSPVQMNPTSRLLSMFHWSSHDFLSWSALFLKNSAHRCDPRQSCGTSVSSGTYSVLLGTWWKQIHAVAVWIQQSDVSGVSNSSSKTLWNSVSSKSRKVINFWFSVLPRSVLRSGNPCEFRTGFRTVGDCTSVCSGSSLGTAVLSRGALEWYLRVGTVFSWKTGLPFQYPSIIWFGSSVVLKLSRTSLTLPSP